MEKVLNYIKKMQFTPNIIGFFVNPFYFIRMDLYKKILSLSKNIQGDIIDVWCWSKPYKELFQHCTSYIWADIAKSWHDHTGEDIDCFYDGKKIPFEDNHFDGVICFEVLEHTLDPREFLKEIHRIVKKDWYVLLSTPLIMDEHEKPYDYQRFTSFWLQKIFHDSGFDIIENKKYLNDLSILSQLFNTYIYKTIIQTRLPRNLSLFMIFMISLIGNCIWLILKIFPKSEDMYLWNVILVKKI